MQAGALLHSRPNGTGKRAHWGLQGSPLAVASGENARYGAGQPHPIRNPAPGVAPALRVLPHG